MPAGRVTLRRRQRWRARHGSWRKSSAPTISESTPPVWAAWTAFLAQSAQLHGSIFGSERGRDRCTHRSAIAYCASVSCIRPDDDWRQSVLFLCVRHSRVIAAAHRIDHKWREYMAGYPPSARLNEPVGARGVSGHERQLRPFRLVSVSLVATTKGCSGGAGRSRRQSRSSRPGRGPAWVATALIANTRNPGLRARLMTSSDPWWRFLWPSADDEKFAPRWLKSSTARVPCLSGRQSRRQQRSPADMARRRPFGILPSYQRKAGPRARDAAHHGKPPSGAQDQPIGSFPRERISHAL